MPDKLFLPIVHTALLTTAAVELLRAHDAVVLERIAFGGGATNWFYCRDADHLARIEADLSPGSVVSFYFDGRIRDTRNAPAHKPEMERIITETGDVVIGFLRDDGHILDVEFVDNTHRLIEIINDLSSTTRVFYGQFPARDSDGVSAVTVVLPDADGTVRDHPH
jgi:hypothetical protein